MQPGRAAWCRMAVDLQLFDHLKSAGNEGVSPNILATKVGADEVLLCEFFIISSIARAF